MQFIKALMEGGGGGRREGLAGVTLGSVLGKEKDSSLRVNRTLLDIIRQEEPNCRVYENIIDSHQGSKKGWKIFKDKRRHTRGLSSDGWAAGVPVPVSDFGFGDDMVSTSDAMVMDVGSVSNQRPVLAQLLRAQSGRIVEQVQENDDSGEVPRAAETGEVQSLNQYLSRIRSSSVNDVDQENASHTEHVSVSDAIPAPSANNRTSMPTRNLSRIPSVEQLDQPVSTSMRLSEALAAERDHISSAEPSRTTQDEPEVTETNNHSEQQLQITAEVTNEEPQVRMSLMDLLEDTDSRQIGWTSYSGDVEYYNGNIDEVNDLAEEEGNNFVERNCCVCMVRHKGSAFIPCGHTFCRLCSRELWVNRGNCPICNGFILEILDIF